MKISVFRSISYKDLLRAQAEESARIQEGFSRGALLIAEVQPVITMGRRADIQKELQDPTVEILQVDRGGLATYHGPGQWVVFPTFHLESWLGRRAGVKVAVETFLQMALKVVAGFSPGAKCVGGEKLGIWNERGEKLVSIGIRIRDGVVHHGLCFNVYPTPESFKGVRPCGLELPVGYLTEKPDEEFFLKVLRKIENEFHLPNTKGSSPTHRV